MIRSAGKGAIHELNGRLSPRGAAIPRGHRLEHRLVAMRGELQKFGAEDQGKAADRPYRPDGGRQQPAHRHKAKLRPSAITRSEGL